MVHSFLAQGLAFINDALRIEDLGHLTKTDNPAKEHRRNGYGNGEIKMVRSVGDQHGACSKTVNDHIDKLFVETKLDGDLIAMEHLEGAVCVGVEPFAGKLGAGNTVIFRNADVTHPV